MRFSNPTVSAAIWFMSMASFLPSVFAQEAQPPDPRRFEPDIQKLVKGAEGVDRVDVVFVGSSSIRMWDLKKSFPEMDLINHGFGGSHIADSTYYAQQLILRLSPRAIVFYAGDNDIAAGLSAEQVVRDYKKFVQRVRGELPDVKIVYISIKPSIARWQLYPKMKSVNDEIRSLIASDRQARFVDVESSMLGEDGRPRKSLFAGDGLHLSDEGYQIWTRLVRGALADLAPPS